MLRLQSTRMNGSTKKKPKICILKAAVSNRNLIGGDGSRRYPPGDGMRIIDRDGAGLQVGTARSIRSTDDGAGRSSYGASSRGPGIRGTIGSFIGGRTPSRLKLAFIGGGRGCRIDMLQPRTNSTQHLAYSESGFLRRSPPGKHWQSFCRRTDGRSKNFFPFRTLAHFSI